METGAYTTVVWTKDGKSYDLGVGKVRPFHDHPREGTCDACNVVNARLVRTGPPDVAEVRRLIGLPESEEDRCAK